MADIFDTNKPASISQRREESKQAERLAASIDKLREVNERNIQAGSDQLTATQEAYQYIQSGLTDKLEGVLKSIPGFGVAMDLGSILFKRGKILKEQKRRDELVKKQLGLTDEQYESIKRAKEIEKRQKEATDALNEAAQSMGISAEEVVKLQQARTDQSLERNEKGQFVNREDSQQMRSDAAVEDIVSGSLESNQVIAQRLEQLGEINRVTSEDLLQSQESMTKAVLTPKEDPNAVSASQQKEMQSEQERATERRHNQLIKAIGGDKEQTGDVKEESGFLGGLLKVMASIGPMIGATIGAIGTGLAAVGAVAGPAIIGSLVLGGAILVIGAAIAGAAALMGASMPIVADGLNKIQPSLKKLEELNGVKLKQAADGIAELFFPLMGLGVGGLLAKLADAQHLGNLGIALQEFDKVDGENLAKVGEGLGPFGGGLFKFALGGAFADLINLIAGNDIKSTMANLAEGLMAFEGLNGENLAGIGQGVSGLGGGFAKLTAGGVLDGLVKFFGGGSPLGDFADDLQSFQDKTQGIEIQRLIRLASAVGILGDTVKKFSELEQGMFQAFGFEQLGEDLEDFADYLDDGEIDTIERAAEAMNKFKRVLSNNAGNFQTGGGGYRIQAGEDIQSEFRSAREQRTAEMDATFASNQSMAGSQPVIVSPNNVQNINNSSQSVSQPIPIVDQSASHRRLARHDF